MGALAWLLIRDVSETIVVGFGGVSLGLWGGLAGGFAHVRGGRLAVVIATGLAVGAGVLALQILLEPH